MKWFLGLLIMYLPFGISVLITILIQDHRAVSGTAATTREPLILVLPLIGAGFAFFFHFGRQPGGFLDLWLNKILNITTSQSDVVLVKLENEIKKILKPRSYTFSTEMSKLHSQASDKYNANEFKDALKYFNKAIKLSPDFPVLYLDRGLTKIRLKDIKGAFLDYNKAIELDPYNSESLFKRGCVRVLFKDHRGAIIDFTKAIEINPKFADAYFQKGLMFWVLNDSQTAFLLWEQASKLGNKDASEMLKKHKDI